MEESVKSVLKLDDLYFSDILFTRKDNFMDFTMSDVDIDFGKEHSTDGNTLKVRLAVRAQLEDHFEINVVLSAKFSVSGEDDKPEKFVRNAIAIMFPYIRSEITLLTSQPNFKPIMIPPINVNALIDFYENQKKGKTTDPQE